MPATEYEVSVQRREEVTKLFERRRVERRGALGRRGDDLSTGLERAARATAALTTSAPRGPVSRMNQGGGLTLFGAYRVEQEVGKLVLGQPHRMAVLGSRARDARRALPD